MGTGILLARTQDPKHRLYRGGWRRMVCPVPPFSWILRHACVGGEVAAFVQFSPFQVKVASNVGILVS